MQLLATAFTSLRAWIMKNMLDGAYGPEQLPTIVVEWPDHKTRDRAYAALDRDLKDMLYPPSHLPIQRRPFQFLGFQVEFRVQPRCPACGRHD